MKTSFVALLLLAPLAACSTPGKPSGFLSSYDSLAKDDDAVRAAVAVRTAGPEVAAVRTIVLAPTVAAPSADLAWMNDAERTALLREVDAQLCFELSRRYDLAPAGTADAAEVRAAITAARPTNRAGSALSAAASFFIPGPIGLRVPGGLGALGAEAEMLWQGAQVAAISWSRSAMAVGMDDPSLSRIGDALQFAEPFADAAADVMTAPEVKTRKVADPDPCAAYGARFRPEGWAAKFATGLYVPQMSGAKKE